MQLYHTPYSPAIAFHATRAAISHQVTTVPHVFQGHRIGHGEQSADGRFRFIVDAAGDADEQVAEGRGRVMAIPLPRFFGVPLFPYSPTPNSGKNGKGCLAICAIVCEIKSETHASLQAFLLPISS